jgi:DNA-cytosine methyltransferase
LIWLHSGPGGQTSFRLNGISTARRYYKKNFPDAQRFTDIRQFDGSKFRGSVDIISGGFPCQPFSSAGKRGGKSDDRYLWPEMLRVIQEVRPSWVVGENVAGLESMDGGAVLAGILTDLENAGYCPEVYSIPAIAVGAPHRRQRLWIIANTNGGGGKESRIQQSDLFTKSGSKHRDIRNAESAGTPPFGGISERQAANSIGVDEGATNTASVAWAKGRGKDNDRWRKQKQDNGNQVRDRVAPNNWDEHWYDVATRICGMDDGIPGGVDRIGQRAITPPRKQKKAKATD